jgi:hypothetical protein
VGTALAMAWLMVALVTAAPNGNQVEAEVESPDGTIAAKNFSQAQLEQLVQRESNGDPTLTQVDPCNSYDGCARCAEDRRCGWCEADGICQSGGPKGPKPGKCAKGAWSFQFCVAESCDAYRACRSCIADPDCGWCPDDN